MLWSAALLVIALKEPAPIATLKQLGPALTACFHAPARSAGSELTVRFSLTKDGAVLGTPKITFSRLVGGHQDQQAFVAAALKALDDCTPVAVTPGLGGAIAGRPLSVRFVGSGGQAI